MRPIGLGTDPALDAVMKLPPPDPNQPLPQPSLDHVAALRWAKIAGTQTQAPWLYEEIGQRLQERIDLVQLPAIAAWANWHYPSGGQQLQQSLAARWPSATCYAPTAQAAAASQTIISGAAQAGLALKNPENTLKNQGRQWLQRLWQSQHASAHPKQTPALRPFAPAPQSVQVLVANMLLHCSPNAQQLMRAWHQSLATDGVLFFSCLGPDTLLPLQRLYTRLGWPAPLQRLVDMHDWGDALVTTGFATPVMEVERLTLTYSSPQALLAELRELGRNLHPQRFSGLRGRTWLAQLHVELDTMRSADGRIHLPIEIIYGHAFKADPSHTAQGENIVSLAQLRKNLLGK